MRAIDDGSIKYAAVLRLLQIYKQLPESDVSHLLRSYHLITDDFREMEDQGLLTMAFVGDEYVITFTLLGRLWLEKYDNDSTTEEEEHGSFGKALKDLNLPEDREVIFVCAMGNRSASASEIALLAGLKNVYNLANGMNGWSGRRYPIER